MEFIPNVHQIEDSFVNAYLIVTDRDLVLIDTGFSTNAKHIHAKIEELGFTTSDLKLILITHTDKDHVGGLSNLIRASNAKLYASRFEGEAIQKGEPSRPLIGKGLMKLIYRFTTPLSKFPPVTIDEFLSDGQVLEIAGGLRVIPTPGHTPEHIAFFLEEHEVLFAGDALRAPAGELHISSGANTWDEAKAIKSAKVLANLKPKIVCCGHGRVVFDAADKMPTK
ncbi:MAG: MBL fold metallo-hydrolase [Anaerolineales bacterium]|nr:MBL fold metallo-hydrolase [Anaerolineales bacterium]